MFADTASAARIKDLTGIKGVRSNQLIGFGLVTRYILKLFKMDNVL